MPSFSPRTQQLGSGDSSVEGAFEQGVTQQAYAQLESTHPELVNDVVTFKVLRSDPDEGVAVAVFVLRRGDRQLYLPVVVSDGEPAPLDMVHDPDLDVFVPLTPEWLAVLDSSHPSSMGKSVRPPDTMFTDVDIRNIVVPPLTGRYSYAQLQEREAKVARTVLRPERLATYRLRTLDALHQASNATKVAFARYLRSRPKLAQHFLRVFGVRQAEDALRTVAATEPPLTGGILCVLGASDKASRFQEVFGKDTPHYYAEARRRGFVGKDGRRGVNRLVTVQPYRIGGEPGGSDVYRVRRADGTEETALVLRNPIDLFSARRPLDRKPASAGSLGPRDRVYPPGRPGDATVDDDPVERPRYLVVLKGGKYFESPNLDVQPVPSHDRGGASESLLAEATQSPSGEGLFVRRRAGRIEATLPMRVRRVWTDSDNTRHVEVESVDPSSDMRVRTLCTAPTATYGGIVAPPGSPMAHLPGDFAWVPLRGRGDRDSFVLDPHDGTRLVTDLLMRAGVRPGTVASAGAGQVSVDGETGSTVREAAERIAYRYYADFSDAVKVAQAAHVGHKVTFYAVPATVPSRKLAAEDAPGGKDEGKAKPKASKPSKPAPDGEPTSDDGDVAGDAVDAAEGQPDPSMQGQDPAMGAPAGPSPTDLATAEFSEELRRQVETIQTQMALLEAVKGRAQQIAGGAPPSPSTLTSMQGLPPIGQGAPTSAPAGPSTAAPSGGADAAGPAAPLTPAAMPPDQASMPSPGAASPGMMAPDMMSPDMMAALHGMMGMGPPDGGAPEAPIAPPFDLMQHLDAGPAQMAGDASMDQTFDAALLSSLSRAPDLQARVVEYLPDLRRAVDDTGRLLLTLRMKRHELGGQVGEVDVNRLLDSAQNSFESLGELVVNLSHNARLPPPGPGRG